MTPREELEALRRLAELEAKAKRSDAQYLPDDPGVIGSAVIGAGRTVDRVLKGMNQLYLGAKSKFESPDLTSLVTGRTKSQRELDALAQQAADEDRGYKTLTDRRPIAAGVGEALPSMILPAGGAATLGGNIARMSIAGAAPGLLEYGSAEERLKRGAVGAAAGAALPLAAAGVKSGIAAAEPLFEAGRKTIAGRTLNRAAGQDAAQTAQRMAQATELVPGSAPTAAQVANNGGIAALERSAAASNPTAYTQRAQEQAAARLAALRGVAGDDARMAAAEAARKAAADPLYKAADAGIAPIDSTFTSLLGRPQFASAVNRAQELARDGGLADIFFRDAAGKPQALIGEGAHFIKKALDEAGEFGSTSYTGKTSAGNASKTNELFQSWLDKSIPEYKVARDTFSRASEPINQMQVGRSLLDSVSPAIADFGALGKETASSYARALRNADQTAAKATGMSGKTMADVLTPQQLATVENVAKDLARKVTAQDLGRGVGSDTFQKLSMQNIAQQSGMPRLVGGALDFPGVARATSWIYRDTDQKVQDLLAEALLNPKNAAQLMEAASKGLLDSAPKTRKVLTQIGLRSGLLAAPAAQGLISE